MFANKFIKTMGLLLGLWSLNSQGSAIYYNAIDLPDANTDDLWRYEYQIVNADFLQDEGFDIYFRVDDGYLVDDLGAPTAATGEWDVQAIQPELALPSPHDGFLDGLALVDKPSLSGNFYIDFIWRGQGSPGRQDYEFYAANLDITQSGQTQPFPEPSVPEPKTLLLMLVGLGGYLGYRTTQTL
jgi:hypothetical protein